MIGLIVMKRFAMRTAEKTALKSSYKRYAHGACVESGGRIFSTGTNDIKIKHPKQNGFSTHAETAAIENAGENAVGSNLYVCRITADKIANSKPCKHCQIVIKSAGIRKVYYSIGMNEWGTWKVQ